MDFHNDLLPGEKLLATAVEQWDECEVYDPGTDSWSITGAMNEPTSWAEAVSLPDGKVMVVGGSSYVGTEPRCEIYDPISGTWTDAESLSQGRVGHTVTLLNDGRLLVVGGEYTGYDEFGDYFTSPLDSCEIYE